MMCRAFVFILAMIVMPLPVRSAEPSAVLDIDPAQERGTVNPMILGHNVEAGNGKGIFGSAIDTVDPRTGRGVWLPRERLPVPDTVAWAKRIRMGSLRYPGGCLTHNFDWRQAVGPVDQRPLYSFGIDEYLSFCRTVGAEPLITISEIADPVAAADLVEYLNAPAHPGHPWAMRRAAWGRSEPWTVRWFELGNETDHGNHDVKPFFKRSASGYASWVRACVVAMRRIDPGIRIGAHVGTGTPVRDPWNQELLRIAGDSIDFLAVHTYTVGIPVPQDDQRLVAEAIMASTEQVGRKLSEYRSLAERVTGRQIPLAVTEFNVGCVQEQPVPWRFTLAAAIHSADQVRLMLDPDQGVAAAHYWQFLNGYWGFLRGPAAPQADVRWAIAPAALMYDLWGRHAGERLIAHRLSGAERLSFPGYRLVRPAKGGESAGEVVLGSIRPPIASGPCGRHVVTMDSSDGSVQAEIRDAVGKIYLNMPRFPVQGATFYRLRWKQRQEGPTGGGVFSPGLGLCDERGWAATRSACGAHDGILGADGWIECETEMVTLPDATGLMLVLRFESDETSRSMSIRYRDIEVQEVVPATVPAYASLTSHAALSADRSKLHLVLFNKRLSDASPLRIRIADGTAVSARVWTIAGPAMSTICSDGEVRDLDGGAVVPGVRPDGFTWVLPPCSMTAIEITRR